MAATLHSIVHDFAFIQAPVNSKPSATLLLVHRLIQFYYTGLVEDSLLEGGKHLL